MKFILVTGGVISGIGKGVISSSLGVILECCGLRVTSIKIDPYINIDAGTFSPFEHGEVFVLDDGGEVDLDLGNYERFLDITLQRDNNITTGKIYQKVINKERRGDYLGKTVQVVPHVTDAIQEWVKNVSRQPVTPQQEEPEICIIELGGTTGDIESSPFIEAFRQFQFTVDRKDFCCCHVSLVPELKSVGECKTKPTQASVRELRGLGLSPDLIFCRSQAKIGDSVREKISNFCHVALSQVICLPDSSSLYRVPVLLEEQGVISFLKTRLDLQFSDDFPSFSFPLRTYKWRDLADRYDHLHEEVKITLVGKYVRLSDAYSSVMKALEHAALKIGCKLILTCINAEDLEDECKEQDPARYHDAWQKLCKSSGIIVPGGFGSRGMTGKVMASQWCRKARKPFLGICLGLQAAVIDYARNVLHLDGADSTEMNDATPHPVVIDMPEHNIGQMGGTMRLGRRVSKFKPTTNSILRMLYGNKETIEERHRHRYEVNPKYVPELEAAGLMFVAQDESGDRMEIIELDRSVHPYFVATQFHPEYISRPLRPSPPYVGLLLAASGKLNRYLARGTPPSGDITPINPDCDHLSKSIQTACIDGLQHLKVVGGSGDKSCK